ncbi:MAG: TRAP transporter small permease subunit [Arenicellales bacterium]|jgi:TRAP-type mannitol/chloroaromatic compound transport system permease small subunit|nr:TRAP transporter small permease subunit [Arenicellales bacterium]
MSDASIDRVNRGDWPDLLVRLFSWILLAAVAVFLVNNILSLVFGWAGISPVFFAKEPGAPSWIQLSVYGAGFIGALVYVLFSRQRSLRADGFLISDISAFLVRAAFWIVLLVGVGDMIVSFVRVEGWLPVFVGEDIARSLGRPSYRGIYVHCPLMILSVVIAAFSRSLGFIWLTLLIVVAELAIVFTRFIFSYEQAFMGDLVRFWYGALFLFASAYTLLEEGHVRVDVFYSGYSNKRKALVNAFGSIFLGLSMCWTIMIVGMGNKMAIINMPVVNFEVSQSGYGMYVKYLMAAFLGVFAVTMAVQFVSYFLDSVADYRGEPGKRKPASSAVA